VTTTSESTRSYGLEPGEPLHEGLARVARGRIDHALDELRGESKRGPDKAVHEARKDMKKLRAVLRLARGALGKDLYRAENAAFRDVARGLAGVRDAQVVIETLDILAEDAGRRLPKRVVQPLRDRLAEQRDALGRESSGLDEAAGEAVGALREARGRVADWPLGDGRFRAVEPGLARVYRQGRERGRAAERKPTVETLHEWRKRVKDLWYHQQLLACAWPEVLEPAADQAHRLSELLGEDHDLAVLADAVDLNAEVLPASEDRDKVHREIGTRRADLQERAFALGRRIYAESPKAFTRRIRRLFCAPRPVL
jgi:CHAD domain-containing protein